MEIMSETLKSLREKKRKSDDGCHFPLFVNNVFNYYNWDGGDDIIREYFDNIIKNNIDKNDRVTVVLDYEDSHGYQKFKSTIVITIVELVQPNSDECTHRAIISVPYNNLYLFKWDSNTKNIKIGMLGDKLICEEDYLYLLNKLQTCGYDFRTGENK